MRGERRRCAAARTATATTSSSRSSPTPSRRARLAGVEIDTSSGTSISLDRGPGGLRGPPPRQEGQRAELDGPGRLARRGRHPRRGDPPGAAARPHLRRRARLRRGAPAVNAGHPGLGRPRAGGRRAARGRGRRARRAHRRVDAAGGLRAGGRAARGLVRRATSGSRTSAACRPTTSTRTSAWPTARCSRAIEGATVHRMRGELGPEDGAAAYESELGEFGARGARPDPARASGPDAHTARCSPATPRSASASGAWWASRRPDGAAGVAHHAHAAGGERERPDRLPDRRRGQGRGGPAGVRAARPARARPARSSRATWWRCSTRPRRPACDRVGARPRG